MSDLRMYCIFSKESIKKMGGNRGKLSSMAGHAYLHAYWDSEKRFPNGEDYWGTIYLEPYKYRYNGNAKKITLVVDTDAELDAIYAQYKERVGATRVVDSGLTVFDGPTLACIGLGPCQKLDLPAKMLLQLLQKLLHLVLSLGPLKKGTYGVQQPHKTHQKRLKKMNFRPTTQLERNVDQIKAATARLSMSALGANPRIDLTRQYLMSLGQLVIDTEKLL